jgi:hypothetical protein
MVQAHCGALLGLSGRTHTSCAVAFIECIINCGHNQLLLHETHACKAPVQALLLQLSAAACLCAVNSLSVLLDRHFREGTFPSATCQGM